ncbi:MAG: hypothetical protein Q9157_001890 [Trypethelium eluteriae]
MASGQATTQGSGDRAYWPATGENAIPPAGFKDGGKAWLRKSNGENLLVTIAASRKGHSGWEYKLKDKEGNAVNSGAWTSEDDLNVRMYSISACTHGRAAVESCPRGYPNFAAFLDSDESFMVYRRFGYLQSRLLLEKQDELRKLETTLDEWDERDGKQDPDKVNRRDLSEEDAAPRRALFVQIEEKFRDYASLLTVAQQLVSFNKPAASDYKSIINYMNQVAPVPKREAAWVRCREDLVTLRHRREHAWLDSGIEHLLKFLQQRMGAKKIIEYLFRSPETKQKCQGPGVYYDHERINNFASGIIIFAILTLLVVPIYVLYHLVADIGTSRSDAICIGVLLVFTLAFSAILSLFTRARRHEILGSAAAYEMALICTALLCLLITY